MEKLEKLKRLGLLFLGYAVLFVVITLVLALLRGETGHFSLPTVLFGAIFCAAATELRIRANRRMR